METVAGATRADLDDEVIQDYLQRRTARLGRDLGQTEDELLRAIGALNPQGQLDRGGHAALRQGSAVLYPAERR